jgi:ATP-binding cassette subfamily F protein 3
MLWLTEHLKRFPHTLLMVSHDRDLLNDVCDHIVHIDQQKLVTYTGNYDRFERTRAERLENDACAAGQDRGRSASTCRPSSTASRPRPARRARRSRASR